MRVFRSIRLLGSATPSNAAEERDRLIARFHAGSPENPVWRYAARSLDVEQAALAKVRTALASEPESPVGNAYLARIDEMALECASVEAVGTPLFAELSAQRFPSRAGTAEALALRWLETPPEESTEETILSDSNDPRSLLSQMKKAIGARKLPFRVTPHTSLAALAATGEESIVVASGRMVTSREVARTVVHEVCGHAEPRVRSRTMKVGLFTVGTARGSDDQEGLALLFERQAGLFDGLRQRQLAARHMGVRWMAEGAEFAEVVTRLIRDVGIAPDAAVRMGERAFRGGDGKHRGLGRDTVYLESLLRVEAVGPDDVERLATGQIAVEWLSSMAEYFETMGRSS